MKNLNLIDKLVYGFNIAGAVGLIFSYLSPHLNPTQFWFISFFGLAYPLLLITNIIFSLYWLIRMKKQIFLSLVVIALGSFYFTKFFQWNAQMDYPPIDAIKVLTHNQNTLGLNAPDFSIEPSKKIFSYLDEELFDVYCFQEFFNTTRSDYDPMDSLKRVTNAKYRHIEYLVKFRNNSFGIATFSQCPIIEKGVVEFDRAGTNMCIFSDIDFNGKVVRVYNMHLQSLHLKPADYKLFETLNTPESGNLEGAKSLLTRLKIAFIKREEQASKIYEHIQQCPYPVIVCGDFNDTPLSYSYSVIQGDLLDSFEENGSGFGSTYNGIFPLLRIDYMFHSKSLKNYYFETKKRDLSDHYPLIGYFGFEDAE